MEKVIFHLYFIINLFTYLSISKTLRGRCTVLFKRIDDNVVMSHVTMDSYKAMQRIFKYIKTPDFEIQFSSYPVTLSSTDDFF